MAHIDDLIGHPVIQYAVQPQKHALHHARGQHRAEQNPHRHIRPEREQQHHHVIHRHTPQQRGRFLQRLAQPVHRRGKQQHGYHLHHAQRRRKHADPIHRHPVRRQKRLQKRARKKCIRNARARASAVVFYLIA